MFYAHIILAKKGPLARIWLAAHWDKKITKAHVFETNIEKSVEGIMQPKVKLALRTSGHLLLGVVRIYSRKAKYLLADCNEAFVKIKMAFRPGMVDLPEGHSEANVNAITLPQVFHDFDTALPELNDIDIEAQFSINQMRADEITLREDYGSLSLSLHDDGFGDNGFDGDTPDLMRGGLDSNINLFESEMMANVNKEAENAEASITLNETDLTSAHLDSDGFGGDFGQPEFEVDLFGDPVDTRTDKVEPIPAATEDSDDDIDHFDGHAPSPTSSGRHSPLANMNDDEQKNDDIGASQKEDVDHMPLDQTNLLQNEDEGFALAPIDASAYKGVTKSKRKRKLIVDEIKNISGEEMKAQLANTSDIVTTLDLAPPTKRVMYWRETGGVEKLFSLPTRTISARGLFLNYQRHLISHFTQLEDFSMLGPSDLLALDQIQNDNEMIQSKRGRKRKLDIGNVVQPANLNTSAEAVSLSAPEQIRDQESLAALSRISLDIGAHENLAGVAESFEKPGSPEPVFSMDHLGSLNDLPMTPGNFHHGIDSADDFNQGDLTPAGLHHGQLTPHHSGIESIESIPNLPADQVSSILNEAENAPQLSNLNHSNELASDWNDYEFPPSMLLQNNADEQQENETSEQFEERVLNKRAAQLFFSVRTRLVKQECLYLSELTVRNTKKQAAQKFYSLLVLKKFRALNIVQQSPYSDICVTRGPSFENPKL